MDYLPQVIGLVLFVTSQWSVSTDAAALNDYILDYQPLQFNPLHIHEKHSRVRRAVDPFLRLNFKAYGRTFNLQLEPSKSVFASNHELHFGDEPPQRVDTSFIYEGGLAGDPQSSAHLSVINGSLSGYIVVPGHTTYHIEPALNHFKEPEFHTIIYPESRMNLDPYRHKRSASGICGTDEIYRNLKQMWQPVDSSAQRKKRETYDESAPHNKYSAAANTREGWTRKKRDLTSGKTCFMSLRADYLLYRHILSKHSNNVMRAKEEILSMFATHMQALNEIYIRTTFERSDGSGDRFRGINFQLQRSTVITNCDTTWDPRYCEDNLDVSNFLDLTAVENHDNFCLVHTFTYRDFVGGTLGLAWVATPDSRSSGVCGKFGPVRDTNNGISSRSLNTGIVTLINFKQEVASRVSQLTFAHEVGHNFGAQHDTTDRCAPYGTSQPGASDGNYIMYPSATQGNLPNNDDFSSCSKDYIAKVLEKVVPNGPRADCFEESNTAFCGNGIVEKPDEECDCGYRDECDDPCCVGYLDTDSANSCKLNGTAQCSPSEGACCSTGCTFMGSNEECLAPADCTAASKCTGSKAECPKPAAAANYTTFCRDYSKVCELGECIGSVCQNIGWIECFMTSAEVSDPEAMCYVSCRKNEDSSECISSYDEVKVNANPDFKQLLEDIRTGKGDSGVSLGVKRPAGSACNDYKGYCDVFSKCRNVDAEGPFKQLTDLIFNPVTLQKIETWVEDHWWAVLLMCVGVVVFMGVFVKIFEYNTPSKNPKSRSQPGQGQGQGRRPLPSRPQHDKRSAPYTTDVPMYDRPVNGRGAQGYGHDNHGYVGSSYQPPPPNYRGQQFDRISGPRKY